MVKNYAIILALLTIYKNMNKKIIYLIIGIVIIVAFGLILVKKGSAPSSAPSTEAGVPSNMAISDELGGSKSAVAPSPTGTVRGSCYIKADSQCMDYLGPIFSSDRIKATCDSQEAIASTGACPVTAKVGGCHAMIGTEMEMISWAYSNGNKPATGQLLEMNKAICNGMAKSQWVGAK